MAVEVVQPGVERQLKMLAVEEVEDQPVFHGLTHHLDHAEGVGRRQVAVAGHVQHRDHLAFGIENRRFKGPPIGDRIAARAAEIAAAEAAVALAIVLRVYQHFRTANLNEISTDQN